MQEDHSKLTEEDLIYAARIAGFEITPANRPKILARLQELRQGVMELNRKIPDSMPPAVEFDAKWGADR